MEVIAHNYARNAIIADVLVGMYSVATLYYAHAHGINSCVHYVMQSYSYRQSTLNTKDNTMSCEYHKHSNTHITSS